MKKSILNLKGAQELTKNEQKNLSGGRLPNNLDADVLSSCPSGGNPTTASGCLCNGGVYLPQSQSCAGGTPTGNWHETATGCCYSSIVP